MAAARAHRGDGAGALASLKEWDAVQDRRSRRYRPLVEALAGDAGAARLSLESAPFRLFTDRASPDLLLSGAIGAQAELGALVQMPALVRGPVEALIDLYERGLRFTLGWPAFVPRVVALGLDAVGREDEAEVWFERALTDARAAYAEAEVARTALEYGRAVAGTRRAREGRDAPGAGERPLRDDVDPAVGRRLGAARVAGGRPGHTRGHAPPHESSSSPTSPGRLRSTTSSEIATTSRCCASTTRSFGAS